MKASVHIEDRLAELAAFHSSAAPTEHAIRTLAALASEVSSVLLAVTRDIAATDWITELQLLVAASGDAQSAAQRVVRATADARAFCPAK